MRFIYFTLLFFTFSYSQVLLKGDTAFVAPFNLEKKVSINKFKLNEKTVSNLEFLEFIKANPEWAKSKALRIFADKNYLAHWQSDFAFGPDSLLIKDTPVVNVSLFAANAYASWRGGRLPSLFEWEYAASAEVDTISSSFNSLKELTTHWMQETSPKYFPIVGTVYKNKFGLYDMIGSVWEWVNDFNSVMMSGDSRSSREIDRSMFCGTPNVNPNQLTNYSEFWRYAYRSSLKANYCLKNLGFRIAY